MPSEESRVLKGEGVSMVIGPVQRPTCTSFRWSAAVHKALDMIALEDVPAGLANVREDTWRSITAMSAAQVRWSAHH